MGVKAEFTRTCDVCGVEVSYQTYGVPADPSIPIQQPNLRENTYMVNGIYTSLCGECAKPLVLAIKLVGACKMEQTNVG